MRANLYRISAFVCMAITGISAFGQTVYNFTTCGQTGRLGPTQSQVNATYTTGNTLNGQVTINTQGIQEWTVPVSGLYQLDVAGAGSGNANSFGGRGRAIRGRVNLTAGQVLKIVVGQKSPAVGCGGTTVSTGGGGGSFVVYKTGNVPIIVAGGGGGFHLNNLTSSFSASDANYSSTSGNNSFCGTGTGGSGGNGGTGSSNGWGCGGGGFNTDGTEAANSLSWGFAGKGIAFVNGATGGNTTSFTASGGFGGGGGAHGCTGGGGGGGGYSGGGGSNQNISQNVGGGGGSYIAGSVISPSDQGLNTNAGSVTITLLEQPASINFDGSNDQIVFPHNAALNVNNSYTFEAWVNPSGSSYRTILSKGNGGGTGPNGEEYIFQIDNSNRVALYLSNGNGWRYSTGTVTNGVWTHVAVTMDGSNVRFYINGVLNSTSSVGSLPANNDAGSFYIGRQGSVCNCNFFSGNIDEVRVWNSVRTQSQIKANMYCNISAQSGLVGLYHLDEGTPGATQPLATTARDYSATANNGTLTNLALTGSTSNWVDPVFREINVKGNAVTIADGDNSPSLSDSTSFGAFSTASRTRSFTIENTGNDTLRISSISVSGTHASDFVISGAPTAVIPGSSQKFYVTLTPSANGLRSAVININSDDCDEALYDFAVEGAKQAEALHFDGSNDYVSIPTINLSGTNKLTIEAWIKPTDITTNTYYEIIRQDGNIDWLFSFQNNGTILSFGLNTSTGYTELDVPITSTDYTDGNWHHVAVVYDGVTKKMYRDGILIGTENKTGTIQFTGSQHHIGRWPLGSEWFAGSMDEIRIWSTDRSCSQLKSTMNRSLLGNESGLIAYYQFNEGIAGATNTGVTVLPDKQTNTTLKNGTLVNFALSGSTSNWIAPGSGVTGTTPDPQPEINVSGNGVNITDGDNTPATSDFTDFGAVAGSFARVFTIQNTGSATLSISSINVSGTNAADFTVSGAPGSIAGGGSANFTVTFNTATLASTKSAVITINNADCDEAAYDFAVQGIRSSSAPGGVSTSLNMWVKANADAYNAGGSSTLATNGQTVDQWNDQSASANHLVQATSANRPTFVTNAMNFNPVLRYNTNQFLDRSAAMGISGTSSHTYFAVFRPNSITGGAANDGVGHYVIDRTTSSNELAGLKFMSTGNPLGYQYRYDNGSGLGAVQTSVNVGSANIAQFHRSYNIERGIRLNNGPAVTTSDNTSSLTPPIIRVGRHASIANGGLDGDIGEVIVYSTYPSSSELARINSYLAIKYGVTLDQSTAQNYVSSSGTVVYNSASGGTHDAYDSDIAGLARDAASALDQRYSRSSNVNARLQMEKPSGFASDQTFLIWGSNGSGVSTVTAGAHPSYAFRLGRVWKADVTGTVGAVTVKILLGTGIANSGVLSDYALLIDNADADFSTGATTVSPSAFSGDTLIFNGVTFADNDHFTLGTKADAPAPGAVSANLNVWLKGNTAAFTDNGTTLATSGQAVQQWNDNSSGRVFRQTNAANKPTLVNSINYNPTLLFSGDQYLDLTTSLGIPGNSDFSYFAVFMPTAITNGTATAGDGSYIIDRQTTTNDVASLKFTGSNNLSQQNRYGNSTGLGIVSTSSLSLNRPVLAQFHRDFNTEFGIALNGGVKNTRSDNSNSLVPPDMRLGRHSTTTNGGLTGELAEVIVYGMYPTASELARVNSYLAIKYGITMDQTTGQDYVNSSGTVIYNTATGGSRDAYDRDITVIGRDDRSALDQRQSSSVNAGSVLTIGNGTIAANNASNGNAFSADNSFLAVGHNGGVMNSQGTADFGVSFNPGTSANETIVGRLVRVWAAQETGTVGTMRLRFDLSAVDGYNGPNTNDLQHVRLLVDGDGSFATGASSISPATYNNGTGIVEFNWDFGAGTGLFFTIGTTNNSFAPLPVTMTAQKAEWKGEDAQVTWTTSMENNNSHFVVESSLNGADWKAVGMVKTLAPQGNSETALRYGFVHSGIRPEVNGHILYRIVSVSLDGNREAGSPMMLKNNAEGRTSGVVVYPNPGHGQFNLQMESDGNSDIKVEVWNATGQRVTLLNAGTLPAGMQSMTLNLSSLSEGVYTLRVYHGETFSNTRLVVLSR